MKKARLLRKFNCNKKFSFQQHLFLLFRVQLVYQIIIIILYCFINMSLRFHFSYVYTTEFWTSDMVASSNLGLAIGSLLMIPYTIKVEQAKGLLLKDLHFTMLLFHIIFCFICSGFTLTISYIFFACLLGVICIHISAFLSKIIEQRNLYNEISKIQREDRKKTRIIYNGNEKIQITQEIIEES